MARDDEWVEPSGSTTLTAGKWISKSMLGCLSLVWKWHRCVAPGSISSCHSEPENNGHVTCWCADQPAWSRWSSDVLQSARFLISTERQMSLTFSWSLLISSPQHATLLPSAVTEGTKWVFVISCRLHRVSVCLQTGSQRTVRFADNSRLFGGTVDYGEPDSRTWVDAHVWGTGVTDSGENSLLWVEEHVVLILKRSLTAHKQAFISSSSDKVDIDVSSGDQRKGFTLRSFSRGSTSSRRGLFLEVQFQYLRQHSPSPGFRYKLAWISHVSSLRLIIHILMNKFEMGLRTSATCCALR